MHFVPTPSVPLPLYPPFVDTRQRYPHNEAFQPPVLCMDATTVPPAHSSSIPQGHLNILPQPFRPTAPDLSTRADERGAYFPYSITLPPFPAGQGNSRRPSDPYPFRAHTAAPQHLDDNLDPHQPQIKRRRSEQVTQPPARALIPAKHITLPPLKLIIGHPLSQGLLERLSPSRQPGGLESPPKFYQTISHRV